MGRMGYARVGAKIISFKNHSAKANGDYSTERTTSLKKHDGIRLRAS